MMQVSRVNTDMNYENLSDTIIKGWVVSFLLSAAFLVTIAVVAAHFVGKYW
jgi:hypothetical protein